MYSFEHAGVLTDPEDEASVIPHITAESFEQLKADGTVSGGMIPKIENALAAVKAGVKRVIITKADAIDGTKGTIIS
jgi:acetylglutamate kinase